MGRVTSHTEEAQRKSHVMNISQYLERMPKAELHVHIEGTIDPQRLFEIAERNGVKLPFTTADEILENQAAGKTDPKQNLASFIECLDVSRSVLRVGLDYEDIAYDFVKRCSQENIVYAEVMFDPQQGIRQGVKFEAMVEGLLSGAESGRREFGVQVQWIMNFQRDWSSVDAMHILNQARPYRDKIVAIGLDNPETPGFPSRFEQLYAEARVQGYHLTSHCDVHIPNSIEHIRGCIEVLGVQRIDHGLNALEDSKVVDRLIEKQISLTACPTRYAFQSATSIEDLELMVELLGRGIQISLNSDDPAQFGSGWLNQTLSEAQQAGKFSLETMRAFMRNGFLSAWLTNDEKLRYLARFDEAHTQLEHAGVDDGCIG